MNDIRTTSVVAALILAIAGCHGASPHVTAKPIDWQTSALDLNLRGMLGSRYAFHCAPGMPSPTLLTGTGIYTDSSSICTAAVHAGVIDPRRGGDVVIQILRGQSNYQGSTQNFVQSQSLQQAWGGSFAVLGGSPGLASQ